MSRPEHLLKAPARSVVPEHIIFVDTETISDISENGKNYQKLRLGVALYYRHRRDNKASKEDLCRFKSESAFWKYVFNHAYSKTMLYLVSHNATFDFIILKHIEYLTKAGYSCKFVYEGGMTFIAKWSKPGHTIMILDNANWFSGKLERWGKELELTKLTMPSNLESEESWFIYCERDARILLELFKWYITFLKDNKLGSWKYTIASSAFNAYRYRFMNHPIYIPDDEKEAAIARESYHGGRTECFRVGEFKDVCLYKVDINSMYPYVMAFYEYPTCFEGYYEKPDISKVHKSLETHAIVANVLVNTTIPYYVYRQNERNIYPIGKFRTVLTTEELKLAFSCGWIEKVYSCSVYRKRSIFKEYVDFFYGIKENAGLKGKKLLRAFAKLYLNSLYGKFGQRGFIDEVIGHEKEPALKVHHGYNLQSGERFTLRQVGHDVIYSEKAGESYNSFCAIAAHVTANARVYLYDCILRAGIRHCLYCDTDSIIVDKTGMDNLTPLFSDNRIGYLKIEGESNHTIVVAPKHYYFDGHWTMKGIRQNAEQINDSTYLQEVWPGFNTILKSGIEHYYTYTQYKTLSPSIISGTIDKQGFISPFKL